MSLTRQRTLKADGSWLRQLNIWANSGGDSTETLSPRVMISTEDSSASDSLGSVARRLRTLFEWPS